MSEPKTAPLKLVAVKTNKHYYVELKGLGHHAGGYRLDGDELVKAWCEGWYIFPLSCKELSRVVSHTAKHWHLKTPELASEKMPLTLPSGEDGIVTKYFGDGVYGFLGKYAAIGALYEEIRTPLPETFEPVPFELDVVFEIDDLDKYRLGAPLKTCIKWDYADRAEEIRDGHPRLYHQEFDKLVFPEIALVSRPVKLSLQDSFNIIREHVKANINPAAARVTSDYDFHFEVKKTIPLFKPKEEKADRGRRYRRNRFCARSITTREVSCYDINNGAHRSYGRPVTAFEGDHHAHLKENIDRFLADLMEMINEPVRECPHCEGAGVVYPEKRGTHK